MRRVIGAAVFAAVLVLAAGGCDLVQQEGEDDAGRAADPLAEIQEHVEVFLAEADARSRSGALYAPAALDVIVQDSVVFDGAELCGLGGVRKADDRPEILIAVNDKCWYDRTEWDREILVFHELGHALLGRAHTDRTLPNGLRGSIMVGGNLFGLYSEARSTWRSYYVDELFHVDTADPDWSLE